MDIDVFLTARLDEDQALAELQPPWPWHLNAEGDEVIAEDEIEVATAFALSNNQQRNVAAHIACHDPARVLAEVAAKRRRLELYVEQRAVTESIGCHPESFTWEQVHVATGCLAGFEVSVRLDAMPYADHPDYNPAWRVE